MKIWVCFSGEYEQRGATATFSDESVARSYSDDVEGFNLWDRLPQQRKAAELSGVAFSEDEWPLTVGYAKDGDWFVKTQTFDADEYFIEWWSGENITWWHGPRKPTAVYVAVKGDASNEAGLRERFNKLRAEIQAGRRPHTG